jgi:HlyD family secretion protein
VMRCQRPTTRFLLPLALVAALAACGAKTKPSFRTDEVTRGDVVESVSATGEVSALVTVSIGTQVSGTVARLYVDFNSPVRKGQLLAELDPRLLHAALERSEAALAAAEADVDKARVTLADAQRTLDRTAGLAKKELVAQADVDAALTQRDGAAAGVKGSLARVQLARADRDTARTNLSLAKITSPIDGVVISRTVDVGQTVAAALQAPTLFTIANDLTRMQILANIDEADIGKVSPGLDSRFTVDAFPGEPFLGHIRDVRPAPVTVQNVVTYAAVIDAPNPDRKLRPGMTASVSIVTAKRADALRVPNVALRWKPEDAEPPKNEGKPRPPRDGAAKVAAAAGEGAVAVAGGAKARVRHGRVYKLEAGSPVAVDVTLGLSDGRATEVLSGLAEGDRVVVGDGSGRSAAPGAGGAPGGGGPRRGLF